MILDIFFPVKPMPKLRARVVGTHAYTPKKTLDAEIELKILVHTLLPKGFEMYECPLHVIVQFYLAKPKSVKKTHEYPIGRPDLDNYVKLISDAMNGIIWKDDSLIVSLTAEKRYMGSYSDMVEGIRLFVVKEKGFAID